MSNGELTLFYRVCFCYRFKVSNCLMHSSVIEKNHLKDICYREIPLYFNMGKVAVYFYVSVNDKWGIPVQ